MGRPSRSSSPPTLRATVERLLERRGVEAVSSSFTEDFVETDRTLYCIFEKEAFDETRYVELFERAMERTKNVCAYAADVSAATLARIGATRGLEARAANLGLAVVVAESRSATIAAVERFEPDWWTNLRRSARSVFAYARPGDYLLLGLAIAFSVGVFFLHGVSSTTSVTALIAISSLILVAVSALKSAGARMRWDVAVRLARRHDERTP